MKKLAIILVTTAVLGAFGLEVKDKIIENQLKEEIAKFEKELQQDPDFDKITYSEIQCNGLITINCQVTDLKLIGKTPTNEKSKEVQTISIDSVKISNMQNFYLIEKNQNGTFPLSMDVKNLSSNFQLDNENMKIYPMSGKFDLALTIDNDEKINKYHTVLDIKNLDFDSKILTASGSYKFDANIPFSAFKDSDLESYLFVGNTSVLPNLMESKLKLNLKESFIEDRDIEEMAFIFPVSLDLDTNFIKNILDTKNQNGTGETETKAFKLSTSVADFETTGKATVFIQNDSVIEDNLILNSIAMNLTDKKIFETIFKEFNDGEFKSIDEMKQALTVELEALALMVGNSKLQQDLVENLMIFVKDDKKKELSISVNNRSAQDVQQISQIVMMNMMMGNIKAVEDFLYKNLELKISVK